MGRILVNIELVKRLSTRLFAAGEQLRLLEQGLSNGMASLEWDGPDKVAGDEQMALVSSRATTLIDTAGTLARTLALQAQEFESADQESAATLFPTAGGATGGGTGEATPARTRINLNALIQGESAAVEVAPAAQP